jgi:hypothetical protein
VKYTTYKKRTENLYINLWGESKERQNKICIFKKYYDHFSYKKIKSSNKMGILHLPLPDIKIMIAKNKGIALPLSSITMGF